MHANRDISSVAVRAKLMGRIRVILAITVVHLSHDYTYIKVNPDGFGIGSRLYSYYNYFGHSNTEIRVKRVAAVATAGYFFTNWYIGIVFLTEL